MVNIGSRFEENEAKQSLENSLASTLSTKSLSKHSLTRIPKEFFSNNMMFMIMSFSSLSELSVCSAVNKNWYAYTKKYQNILWRRIIARDWAFGKSKWAKHFGDVGEEPPLPKNICEILKSPCPVFPEKRVKETHMLTLIPKEVDQQPLDLDTLEKLVQEPKEGHKSGYRYYKDKSLISPVNKTYWVLMLKDVLNGSVNRIREDHEATIKQLSEKAKGLYRIPKAIEAAVSIFMKFVEINERLFIHYTRCQETEGKYYAVVGSFYDDGMGVRWEDYETNGHVGVTGLREF